MLLVLGLLLGIQHQAKHVETKLGEVEAHLAEGLFGLVPEHVASMGPEGRDGLADGRVVARSGGVDVSRVGDLALGGRVDTMDLRVRQRLQFLVRDGQRQRSRRQHRRPRGALATYRQIEPSGQGVDASVHEQLLARVVDGWGVGVLLERSRAGELLGKVFTGVEVLQQAADRI